MSVDMDFVTSRMATGGGLADETDIEQLESVGITHVIDCRAEMDDSPLFARAAATASRISYLWQPTLDDGQHKPASWFGPGISFTLYALNIPKAKIYIHCRLGHNRGPSMTYAVLRALGLSPVTSEYLVRSARPQVTLAYKADADQAVAQLGYAAPSSAKATMKVPKPSVDYRPATDPDRCCRVCTYMSQVDSSCQLVQGDVQPQDVCNLFRAEYS